MELSNKTMMTGSLKLIWAIFQALFIGFVQTLGSDVWLRIDWTARAQRQNMMNAITQTVYSEGILSANWTTAIDPRPIMLSVSHTLDLNTDYPKYNFVGVGCYRGPDWPWYIQGLDWKWTIPLVPLFAFLLTVWNLQAMRRAVDAKHVFIMVLFGCASYAGELCPNRFFFFCFRLKYSPPSANFAGQSYIHGSVGSALGAFAVSLLGCIYTRVWQGYAFAAMVPGILFLVPSGLTAAGGLAQNYGTGDDQFSSGLSTGLAMIECELVFTLLPTVIIRN